MQTCACPSLTCNPEQAAAATPSAVRPVKQVRFAERVSVADEAHGVAHSNGGMTSVDHKSMPIGFQNRHSVAARSSAASTSAVSAATSCSPDDSADGQPLVATQTARRNRSGTNNQPQGSPCVDEFSPSSDGSSSSSSLSSIFAATSYHEPLRDLDAEGLRPTRGQAGSPFDSWSAEQHAEAAKVREKVRTGGSGAAHKLLQCKRRVNRAKLFFRVYFVLSDAELEKKRDEILERRRRREAVGRV